MNILVLATIYPIKLTKKDHGLDAVTVRTVGFGPADDSKFFIIVVGCLGHKSTCIFLPIFEL